MMKMIFVFLAITAIANAATVGVRFGGYHASAGLGGGGSGGLLGGLHAEAGTPFQEASAGLGGSVGQSATGGLYAGASGTKTLSINSDFDGGAVVGGGGGGGALAAGGVVENHPEPTAHKTYIERTVIPNYVEKTVRVPTYVEKTIRVPSYVEQKVKVPAAPTIVEKTVSEIDVPAGEYKPSVGKVTVVNKHVEPAVTVHRLKVGRPGRRHFRVVANGNGSYKTITKTVSGGLDGGHGAPGLFGGLFTRSGVTVGGAADGGDNSARNLFNNIFQIPIATLDAVNKLVGDIAVSKSITARAY